MIITENITINGTPFTYTHSDSNRYVVRDGINYAEAYDPTEYGRTYTEGEEIPNDDYDIDDEETLNIILGGAE